MRDRIIGKIRGLRDDRHPRLFRGSEHLRRRGHRRRGCAGHDAGRVRGYAATRRDLVRAIARGLDCVAVRILDVIGFFNAIERDALVLRAFENRRGIVLLGVDSFVTIVIRVAE